MALSWRVLKLTHQNFEIRNFKKVYPVKINRPLWILVYSMDFSSDLNSRFLSLESFEAMFCFRFRLGICENILKTHQTSDQSLIKRKDEWNSKKHHKFTIFLKWLCLQEFSSQPIEILNIEFWKSLSGKNRPSSMNFSLLSGSFSRLKFQLPIVGIVWGYVQFSFQFRYLWKYLENSSDFWSVSHQNETRMKIKKAS